MDTDSNHCTDGCNCNSQGGDPTECARMTGNRMIWKYGDEVAAAIEAQDQQNN